jgi:resuscitation-promoting factor RpfA
MQNSTTAPLRARTTGEQHAPRRGHRTATALVTTLGAAAVVSTTFAVPADAAVRHSVWDRVANCESSQRWHINTGNGYYGGLQFSASTWAAYHGHRYARQANRASRAEQIEVARRVLASQGPHAWPVCGPHAGLTRNSGHATHAPLPHKPGTRVKHPHGEHKTRHRHHARKVRRSHHKTYRVRHGDTLSGIARRQHVPGGWHALYRANHKHLHNPNVLRVGQLLRLP